jgi:putative parathymosin
MMEYYEELVLRKEEDKELKENVQKLVVFVLEQFRTDEQPETVKNRHEGYGIAAEKYCAIQRAVKDTKSDMDDLLKILSNEDADVLNVFGSLYNSAVEVAVESITLAMQIRRVMDDLYKAEQKVSPIEKYIEELEGEDEFEDADDIGTEE